MISLCLHMHLLHLSYPSRTRLFQRSQAIDQESQNRASQWPNIKVASISEDSFFVTVPELLDEIVHSKLPADLKDALQLACDLGIKMLYIDIDGAVLHQLHYYGE